MDPYYSIGDFSPDRSIGYLIRRAAKLATAQVEDRFAGDDVTMSHWMALAFVKFGKADNCAKLSRLLGHNSGATTRLVDQLEERGLVRRGRDGVDRRVVALDVTEDGEARLRALTPPVIDLWNEVLAGFGRAEVDRLIGQMTRVVDALEALDARAGAPGEG